MKIGDFGCAVYSKKLRTTVVGCYAYFSPEQLSNSEYDEKIDIWSLGILTYELLTGKPPFEDDIIRILQKEKEPRLSKLVFPENITLSEEAVEFVSLLLKENPEDRMNLLKAIKHPFIVKHRIEE